MGSVLWVLGIMQFLIVGSLFAAGASAQLVHYPNGAVAPYDPNNAAATAAHLQANAEAGKLINPFGVHASGLVHPVHYYGKRDAQTLDPATNLVTYPNGAVAPFDPNVAAATAYHYSAKAAHGYYPFLGAANVHPAAAVVYGRKKREAQVPVSLVTGLTATSYLGPWGFGHLAVAPVTSPFTAHPNGALVPAEPADVVEAREAHLAAVAEAGRKKREAQVPVNLVTGVTASHVVNPYFGGLFGHHLALAPVTSPFTAHPNGALVPRGEPGGKATVMMGHEKKVFKSEEIGQANPPKFEKCEDMSNLTYLNEASVFHNLDARFKCKLIYTYSGLFCIVVNPYKRYPIYTGTVVKMYLGKRKNEVPPHLWAITETAYRNMLTNIKDQSMLITGESGAGKTENTKKVISYLAAVAAPKKKPGQEKKAALEDQIVATNPILESYGNAKTSRNDNSSRFGKFIRIHFNSAGKLCGCDIESYLLEKSRITQQQSVERSYHIFYQLLQPHVPTMKSECLLGDDIYDYIYVSQGKVTVASIDDNEELEMTDAAFDIIGFSNEEKWDCYKITAGVMSSGQIEFVQKGRDDQAEPGDMAYPTKVAACFGIDPNQFLKAFCKPKIKVGAEWVTKGQTCDQATSSMGGIARASFDRLFKWLII